MRRWYYAVPLLAVATIWGCGADNTPTAPRGGLIPAAGLGQVSGAGFTTFVDAAQCTDGNSSQNSDVDCNNYASKDGVYMSGGPTGGAALTPGAYYFSVLAPSGQNTLPFTLWPAGRLLSTDAVPCRTFSVDASEAVTYNATTTAGCTTPLHWTGLTPYTQKPVVRLSPYLDTPNNGGVYILAICSVNATSAANCKYDAFRIRTTTECPDPTNPDNPLCGPDLRPVLAGLKYYDANRNGQFDASESTISGWKVNVGSDVRTTDDNGVFADTVDAGTYLVTEQQAGHGWVETGNTVDQTSSFLNTVFLGPQGTIPAFAYSVVAVTNGTTQYLNFGNVCAPTPGGHTLGFWSNKNGQALVSSADLQALRDFNLIKPSSSAPFYVAFDPTSTGVLATWLLNGTATNMSYMLGVQMTATYLSLQHGFTANVNVDNAPSILSGNAPPRNVTQEIAYANALLANYPYTVASSSARDELERVKSLFDAINNGQSLPQPTLTDGTAICGAPSFLSM